VDGEFPQVRVQRAAAQQLPGLLDQAPQTPQGDTQHRQHPPHHRHEAQFQHIRQGARRRELQDQQVGGRKREQRHEVLLNSPE